MVKVLREKFGLPASIKWPNDVLIGHKKAVGILTEMQSDQDFSRFIVMGIGINVNHTREDLSAPFRYPATSIAIEAGVTVKRQYVLTQFLHQFEKDYEFSLRRDFRQSCPK